MWKGRAVEAAVCSFPEQVWSGLSLGGKWQEGEARVEDWWEGDREEGMLWEGAEGLGEGEEKGELAAVLFSIREDPWSPTGLRVIGRRGIIQLRIRRGRIDCGSIGSARFSFDFFG